MKTPGHPTTSQRQQPGLTIIELLTAILIIGILAGLLATALSVARTKAKISGTISDLKNLEVALTQFRDEFGFFPPSKVSDYGPFMTPASGMPLPPNYAGNFVNSTDPATEANALRPITGPGAARRNAFYEENGNEIMVLCLLSKRHGGPFWGMDMDRVRNQDGDQVTGNVLNSYHYQSDSNVTPLLEYYDRWENPWVYTRSDRYNSNIAASVDETGDGLSEIDGASAAGRTRRINQLDVRTSRFYKDNGYQIYSFGPNRIDNLGFGGAAKNDSLDNDQNGVVDDEDDIGNYHH